MLIALGLPRHNHHTRVTHWLTTHLQQSEAEFATCAIIEIGFVRVLYQLTRGAVRVEQGCEALEEIKRTFSARLRFLIDDQDASRLPRWVRTGPQTTDGHLVALAEANGAVLATLDEHIPEAFVIPLE